MLQILILFSLALGINAQGDCADADIVRRSEWGARPPRSRSNLRTPVRMVFIHHTAGTSCNSLESCSRTMRNIQNFHMNNRGWSDIGYSWLVGEDGRAYEGRGWTTVGAHTRGYNSQAVAVSVMGTFTSRLPNAAALDAVQDIIACGIEDGYVTADHEMFGHRDGGCTSCPGDALYDEIQDWPRYSDRNIPRNCRRWRYGDEI